MGNKAPWDKFQETVDALAPLGPNVFATKQNEWPRHRKVVSPAFNGLLYQAVTTETIATYYDCLATQKWEKEREFIMSDVPAITSKFALYLVAKCGFGIHLTWNEEVGERVDGKSLPECFDVTSRSVVFLSLLPRWMIRSPIPAMRRLYEASNILEKIVQDIIDKRRAEGLGDEKQAKDIFSMLLSANDLEKGSAGALSDRELVSNVFFLLLAGHETTGKALAATLGELACNPHHQQRAYEEVMSVLPDGRDPSYTDIDRLPFVQACFMEGLRMFPSVPNTMRGPIEDTVLQNKQGGITPFRVPKGTPVTLDFFGLSYNERVYPEPDTYKPERWLDPKTEPLSTFSYGPRVCIGKRFAMVESTCLLALLLLACIMGENVESVVGFGHKRFALSFTRRNATTR
ncbi:cytochrome P450 [Dacryopinax primogenitus]|uniref:Cytochrome P450 n=1 Tax=Dacryopinax primogenitus (strain DJM 731) TaxID=1858805 RepID=M5FTF3_DACPD|nr:cytochrome P450 [Dacryopinax primogenitus]EJT98659.1 cytochrome P450 [Dacryopinax primogenitus]